ncbi:MAG: phage holin family protein [Candidatus Pseudoruminococcus sp.]|nr:phage holin family protein [Candidatus Pseudoruminococcus sp.]
MDKQTTIQAVITAALAALTYYFSILTVPIIVLMAVMVIDYITGMVSAWHNAELSSKKGVFGIIKKLCYLALVCVGMGVDWLIYSGMTQVGITMNYTVFFGILVAIWLIINELISILENLNRIGVPLPKFITVIVKKHGRN